MGRIKLLFILAFVIFCVTACDAEEKEQGFIIVGENVNRGVHTVTLDDGEYRYVYDLDERKVVLSEVSPGSNVKPSIYLINSDHYSLQYVSPIVYYGTYEDFCGYVNSLYNLGFECVYLNATSNLYDIKLSSEEYTVRVIYQGKDEIKILSKNKKFFNTDPPYINEKDR